MTATLVKKALRELASQEKAETSAWFFKTEPGQYGYGDKFIGVTVPEQRKVATAYSDLSLSEIQKLLDSAIHEDRFTALVILCNQYKSADIKTQKAIYYFYLDSTNRINNWDLVDVSAHKIVGKYLLDKSRGPLFKLAQSDLLWERRIAIVATWEFIRNDDFADTLEISRILLHDAEDLMHKASGWMLREAGKRDLKVLLKFLDKHAHEMPRTMLRYSIEKLNKDQKKHYMQAKALRKTNN